MKGVNDTNWHEVVADQAMEILRLRKKCSEYARAIARFEGVVTDMERERKNLVEKIQKLGGLV